MAVAYLLEQGTLVKLEGQRLVILKGNTVFHSLHLFKLDQLIIFGNVSITPPAMKRLLSENIDTVFMSRHGRYQGRLQPPWSKNITLRCAQFERLSDEEKCLDIAKAIVRGKITNLRTVLMRLNRNREGLKLEDQILQLKRLSEKVAEAAGLDILRGIEGKASALHFEGFSKGFLADGISFAKRVRRPPTDPVNALLSLGYTLLFNSVMAAVSLVGFDPYLGALHTVEYGRPSLPLDLMEEWRPVIVDSIVLGVFNLKALTLGVFIVQKEGLEHIGKDVINEEMDEAPEPDEGERAEKGEKNLPVRLTSGGFRKYIVQFERKMKQKVRYHLTGQELTYRDCIREQVRHFARVIRGDEKEYRPMELK